MNIVISLEPVSETSNEFFLVSLVVFDTFASYSLELKDAGHSHHTLFIV